MPVRCSIRDCGRDAVFLSEGVGLCVAHIGAVARLLSTVKEVGAILVSEPKPPMPPPPPPTAAEAKPVAEAARKYRRRVLRTDGEIEEAITKRLEKFGNVSVAGLLGTYSIDRGGHKSAVDRVLAVMSRMVERDPARLELTGSGSKAILRVRVAPPPAEAPREAPAEPPGEPPAEAPSGGG